VAQGIKGFDPIANNQLDQDEISRCEKSPAATLRLKHNPAADGESKRKGPRYTPLSKRQDRPAAIAWLVKFHPELTDGQISKLVGTTKPTIQTIRDRSHWNMASMVALGLCKQLELDEAVAKASKRRSDDTPQPNAGDLALMGTAESLAAGEGSRMDSGISGHEAFALSDTTDEDEKEDTLVDADSLFNLPSGDGEDEQPG